jgi:hypothetical protein
MTLFEDVFNKASIYDMLFFNVKSVLMYPTLDELKEQNQTLYERWKYLSINNYNGQDSDVELIQNRIYEDNAVFHPEFSKIITITYASLNNENGQFKRNLKKIVNKDEMLVVSTFMDVLHQLSSEGVKSTPKYFPMFCGHNIVNFDIPLLIKRFILHRDSLEVNKQLPFILKNCLNAKPWESTVIDTVNVWKFNSNNYTPLMLIADYLGLKKTIDLDSLPDVSKKYWDLYKENPEKALEYIALQSATQTNLVIQLMVMLRQL